MEDPKPVWESKTLWVNVLTAVAMIIAAAVAQPDLIPAEAMRYVVFALAAVNIILRLVTSQPVTLTRNE
jgi:hypothetical protein